MIRNAGTSGTTGTQAAVVTSVLPIGAPVWLRRENRRGRIVARAHGGLLYRIRLDGGDATRLLERPACELGLLGEDRAA